MRGTVPNSSSGSLLTKSLLGSYYYPRVRPDEAEIREVTSFVLGHTAKRQQSQNLTLGFPFAVTFCLMILSYRFDILTSSNVSVRIWFTIKGPGQVQLIPSSFPVVRSAMFVSSGYPQSCKTCISSHLMSQLFAHLYVLLIKLLVPWGQIWELTFVRCYCILMALPTVPPRKICFCGKEVL